MTTGTLSLGPSEHMPQESKCTVKGIGRILNKLAASIFSGSSAPFLGWSNRTRPVHASGLPSS